jgi:hypothetical protein
MFQNAEICNFDSRIEDKLEPRLTEYLKRKQYYKDNNIEGSMLEKEFNIDKNDIAKIKNYFQGKKLKKNIIHSDMIQPDSRHFPSEDLQHDNRLQKIKNKQQRDREAVEQKNNYDVMARGYDMYRDDRKFASAYGDDFKSRFNPQVWMDDDFYRRNRVRQNQNPNAKSRSVMINSDSDQDSEGSDFENSNPNIANKQVRPNNEQIKDMRKRYSNPNIYKNKPASIRYKDYMTRGCNEDLASPNYSLDSIIGKLDTYNNNLSNYHREDEMDLDMKVSVPGAKCSNKREKENNYRAVPYMNGSKMRDVDIENYLCYGSGPSRGSKSLGYPNPAEHYFQYISDDVSKPEHTVFEPGMPTRMRNKDTARSYKTRDVM